ncbi:hypothetical protein D3C86_1674600 [compost metagenome]
MNHERKAICTDQPEEEHEPRLAPDHDHSDWGSMVDRLADRHVKQEQPQQEARQANQPCIEVQGAGFGRRRHLQTD